MKEKRLVIALLGLTLSGVGGIFYILYQIIKQQGRLLLRLDDIERHLGMARIGAQPTEAEPGGLEVGTTIESFTMPDLEGNQVGLDEFRGKRVLMVNWNPGCGFCDRIADELARLHPDLLEHNTQLLLLSHGDAEANRKAAQEHGLKCPVLLQGEKPLEAFASMGTPVAYLLDEEGKVAAPIAIGANAVPELAQAAAKGKVVVKADGDCNCGKRKLKEANTAREFKRPLSQSRLVRDGLKAGTPAPTFTLPDVHGKTVSLEEFRGRRVLLVFSDPHCGPCQQLTPALAQLHHEHRDNNLAVVMVGRGDLEENRRKAEEYGLEFPVVLQDKWKLSKEYGIFATPAAFLINEEGIIAHNVAQGMDEILALTPHDAETHNAE